MNSLVKRFVRKELGVGENFAWYLIIDEYINTTHLKELEEHIDWGEILNLKSSYGRGKPQRDGAIFIGRVDSLRHHAKILIWQLEAW